MLINWFDWSDRTRVWVTGDQHFGHARIIEFCSRPYHNVEAMDEDLIETWNALVKPDDIVFHLGDFTLGDSKLAERYFGKLNGRIFVLATEWHHDRRWLGIGVDHHPPCLLKGSHGPVASMSDHSVQLLPAMCMLELGDYDSGPHPLAVTLCHYPVAEWDRKHYGAVHLHGHSHGQHPREKGRFDVGVDMVARRMGSYAPLLLADAIAYALEG